MCKACKPRRQVLATLDSRINDSIVRIPALTVDSAYLWRGARIIRAAGYHDSLEQWQQARLVAKLKRAAKWNKESL